MSKFSTIIGFIVGAVFVISFMSTALSWVVYLVCGSLFGPTAPFWVFWSGCSMAFIGACFLSTIRRY